MEFKELNIIEPILRALHSEGYINPTPIQEKAIPLLLENKDLIGIAQTGTGKTAAFTIPILQKLDKLREGKATMPKALIIAPTRELVLQISESFRTYGKFLKFKELAVYGGVGIAPQIKMIYRGVDILIATPGRLMDLMNQRKINLNKIKFFVLDEADRMLDMGFVHDIKKIASSLPLEKQSLFFSATMSNEILNLTKNFLKNPTKIEIASQSVPIDKIEQSVFFVDMENKNELLLDLIKQEKINRAIIFVGMKHKADKITRILNLNKIGADAIHGDKSQHQRNKALNDFKIGKIKILVATDIAARGIDIDNVSHVINYDLPNEPENYIHRIGRTARAGAKGIAYSFCEAQDKDFLNQIEKLTKIKTPHADHKYHSMKAKNAEGAEAKPTPRGRGNLRRKFAESRKRESSRRPEKRNLRLKNNDSRKINRKRTISRGKR